MSAPFNRTVLMSDASQFDNSQAINPFMDALTPVEPAVAHQEHTRIRQALEGAGVDVVQVKAPAGCQDGVYTANWGLVRGDIALMSRLPNARKAEEPYAAEVLRKQGKTVVFLPEGLKWSGQGDALPCGQYLFAGSGYRSDPAAQQFVADTLGYELVQLKAVPALDASGQPLINAASGWPDSFYYDLDLAISILKQPTATTTGLIGWCPAAFTPESQEILRNFHAVDKIEVSETEAKTAFACNLVSTGETVVMNDGAPEYAKQIEKHGLKTVRLSNPELGKGGGSIRCTTLTLDNQ